ncbi:MAG: hypothetical protein GY871_04555 [Actinomycetales bacterium]|nr:hypothetical protein [Actinomycetales bacterium]
MATDEDAPKPKRKRAPRKKPATKKAPAARRRKKVEEPAAPVATPTAEPTVEEASEAAIAKVAAKVPPKPDRLAGIPPHKTTFPWRSHVTVMAIVLDVLKPKRIIEAGCGPHSTLPFLDALDRDVTGLPLLVVEPIEDWARWVSGLDGVDHRDSLEGVTAAEWAEADLVFVDGPRETRAPAIGLAARAGAKTIVVHDADKPRYYSLPLTLPGYETRVHLQNDCGKGTRIYTKIPGLIRTVRTRCLDHFSRP